jgi:hypothetical protein
MIWRVYVDEYRPIMDESMSTLSDNDKQAVDCLMRLKPGQTETGKAGDLVDMETDERRLKATQGLLDLLNACPVAQPPGNLVRKTLEHVRTRGIVQKSDGEKKNPDQPG